MTASQYHLHPKLSPVYDAAMFVTIGEAASYLKVSNDLLRLWEERGQLIPERSVGGQRRYDVDLLRRVKIVKEGRKLVPVIEEEAV